LPLLGFAVAGVLLGHALSYAIALPDPHHRDLVLRQTGHAYLQPLGQAALIAFLAGVATVLVRACSRRRGDTPERFGVLAGTLAAIQLVAFLGQEVAERVVSGSPLEGLAHDHVLAIGLAMQLLLALVGAALLRWLARTSANIADGLMGRPALAPPSDVPSVGWRVDRPARRIIRSPRSERAPPA
jgi:hypothetical protein